MIFQLGEKENRNCEQGRTVTEKEEQGPKGRTQDQTPCADDKSHRGSRWKSLISHNGHDIISDCIMTGKTSRWKFLDSRYTLKRFYIFSFCLWLRTLQLLTIYIIEIWSLMQ